MSIKRRETIILLCECGCGQQVKWSVKNKCWNRFISGHNKGRLGMGKSKTPPQPCECGCGQMANVGNRFIIGHNQQGVSQSKEEKDKKSKSMKLVWSNPRFRKKQLKIIRRVCKDEERNRKISESNTGKIQTKEHNENISKGRIGIIFTEEHCKNISKAQFRNIEQPGYLENMSIQMKKLWANPEFRNKLIGENASNWQGGISKLPYSQDWTEELKEYVRERDNCECQLCFISQDELNRRLDIHHIDYDKKNCNEDNLISLCVSCHAKTTNNRQRWINYFNYYKKLKKEIA
jgi:hypothetical protein